jgi:hypothetical protein
MHSLSIARSLACITTETWTTQQKKMGTGKGTGTAAAATENGRVHGEW